jgi:hypothetical protein
MGEDPYIFLQDLHCTFFFFFQNFQNSKTSFQMVRPRSSSNPSQTSAEITATEGINPKAFPLGKKQTINKKLPLS